MKNIFKITFLVFTVFCLFYFILPVQAQILGNEDLINFGEAAGYGEAPLPQVIGNIVKIGLSLLGLIAVIIIIAGGFIWMTSGGVVDKVTKAKKIISSGLIGLLIIVFAYAIVAFVISQLFDVTGQASEREGEACTPGLCCGPSLRCDAGSSCNISDPGCSLPPDAFKIRKIETTHGGFEENYNQDVYLCSAVQPIFNHSVDDTVIQDLAQANELRIQGVTGTWQTRNNTLIFKHPDLFTENESYEAYFPKAILDSQGKILQQCLAAGGCVSAGNYFIWNFNTGTTIDTVYPEITSTYPIFNPTNPNYPDQNISRRSVIEVSFSESIDITTVADENNYPIETNIWLAKLDGEDGSVVGVLSKDFFEIRGGDNGFEIHLRNGNLLEPFVWYRIHVEGVEDLCLNAMATAIEWEFQTNDQVPGVGSQYPTGDTVCPDADITVVFNTQMYDNLVRFEITGEDNFTFDIRGSELSSPYEKTVSGGVFKITDPGDLINNHFRVFTFDPDDNLQSELDYQVTVLADLVIDQQGTLLSNTWEFTTATMGNCFCAPWISRLEPAQGSKGECVTLYGQCFKGTATQPALPIKIDFTLDGTPTEASIEGASNNYLTTQMSNLYSEGDLPEVQATIEYDGGDQLVSNLVEFYIDSNEEASGPCLFSINPSDGYSNETEVDLSGIRFDTESAKSQVVFYNNKSAVYQTWGEQQISSALVPSGAEDGLVYVENDQGASNALPFDVLQHQGGPGQACQEAAFCPENPSYNCSTPYECLYEATDTCRCCCDPSLPSELPPLECLADQGSCTGGNRGLYCGCENDVQCGNGLGCGLLDQNQCCYARPTITSNNPTGEVVCLNIAIEANFSQEMDRRSLNKDNIQLIKLPPLVESKFGRNYTTTQYTSCLDQSSVYTGRCDVNWWDYSFNVSTDGNYQIYVETSNYSADVKDFGEDGVCSEPGIQHHVKVFVDSVEKGDFCADATLGHQISNVSLGNIITGTHTIRLEWDNKWFESPNDSNIRIYQVDLRQEVSEQDVGYTLIINEDNDQVSLLPIGCKLDTEIGYKVELIGGIDGQGIRDSMGVSMNNYNWQFTTGDENNLCEVNSVLVSPDSAIVESFEDSVVYMAQGYDFNNNQVCVAEFLWESDDINIAVVNPSQALETTVSPVGGEGEQTTDISATLLGYSDSGEFTSVLSPPVITGLSPGSGNNNPSIPTYVTITGTNFGNEQNDSYVEFGFYEAEIGCQNWSDTEIVVIVPPDLTVGQLYSVTITRSDQGQSNGMFFEVTDEFHPAICKLEPNQGKTNTLITIRGTNFGDQQRDAYVVFGEGGADPQTIDEIEEDAWFNTEIIIIAPEVPEEVANVVVYVPSPIEAGSLKPSNIVSFYKSPRITSISPEKGPKRTWITIKGENFGSNKGKVYFKYDDIYYLGEDLPGHCSSYWTNQEIIIVVPETLPEVAIEDDFYQSQVYIETASGTQSDLFGWEVNKEALAPALCGITPNEDLQVNDLVNVIGDRFDLGSGELDRRLIFNQDKAATSLDWTSNTEISNAVIPSGTISGNVFIEKDVQVNCHLECDGFSFAGRCFGTMIEVCNEAQIRSNPLSITLLQIGDPETFELPQVFENSTCSNNIQTPSPRYLSSQACNNALISARFNMEVDNLSNTNIIIKKCNPGNEEFDSELCTTNVSGTIVEIDKSFVNPQHNAVHLYPDITTANRFCFEQGYTGFKATYSTVGSFDDYIRYVDGEWVEENSVERISLVLCSKGFIYTPSVLLDQNYWYQVVLKSGATGIISSVDNYQLDGNKDGNEDGSPNDDYIWYFKTKNESEICSAQAIKIFEQDPIGVIVESGTKDYSALPIGPDCQILRPDTFTWTWESTEPSAATIALQVPAYTAMATAVGLGETEIEVTATPPVGESATNSVDLVVATYPNVESFQPSGSNICRNSVIKATFDQIMNRYSLSKEKIKFYKWDAAWQEITSTINISIFDNAENKTEVSINAGLLDSNREYKVTILGGENGVESIYGIDMAADYNSTFTTSDEICTLSQVDIEPKTTDFTATGESENLIAYTYDNQGGEILGIPGVYNWTWLWESSDASVVSVAGSISESEIVTAQNRNGQVQITATATPSSGDPVSGQSEINVFICDYPWSFEDSIGPGAAPNTQFRLSYCKGDDSQEEADRLPELSEALIEGSDVLIKEFLFSIGDSGDIIGLKVFNNSRRLSILNWYKDPYEGVPNPGNPKTFTIDNYLALREGRTTYVGATNIDGSNIYSYIYLISYNNNAQPDTLDIYNQILNNWEFNVNLGGDIESKTKIQNDLSRLYNFEEIKDKLNEYHQIQEKYPILGGGTYVLGKTNSLWPSWENTLSEILEASLPNDPINEFNGPCAGCDDEPDFQCDNTCYNPITRVDEIPNGSHVYQYYVPEDPGCVGEYYTLSANLEYGDGGITWKGEEDVITTRSDSLGDFNYIYYSPETPVCGDGTLQCGEQCDCSGNYQTCCSPFQTGYCPGTTFPSEGFIPSETCENLGYQSEPTGFLECNNCSWSGVSCAKRINGEACGSDDNCHSGNCADGVCCDTSCTGNCEYCGDGYGGSAGVCHNVSVGNDPRDVCNNTSGCLTGNCDGSGFCTDYYTSEDRNCSSCQTCDGASSGTCVNRANNTQDTTGLTLCQDTCKKCYNGACVNQTTSQDLFTQCDLTWNACNSDCVRRGGDGLCDTGGVCDTNDRTGNIASGNVCTGNGDAVSVSTSNYCGTPENSCTDNSCSGTRWYRSCNNSGTCRNVGDHTGGFSETLTANSNYVFNTACGQDYHSTSNYCGSVLYNCTDGACSGTKYYRGCTGSGACKSTATGAYAQIIYPNTGKTLTASCGVTGTTLCNYSSYNACNSDCVKKRDQLRCSAGHSCSYDVGNNTTNVAENKVCVSGSEVTRSSTYYCGISNSCTSGACSGTRYYRGCTSGGACKTNNTGAASVTVNANPGNILTSSCGQSTAQCATCRVCDGSGDCDPVTGIGPPPYLGAGSGICCTGVECSQSCCGNTCCAADVVCCNGSCCAAGEICDVTCQLPPRYNISGNIAEALTGNPVNIATVIVKQGTTTISSTTTNSNGDYSFSSILGDITYHVFASKTNFTDGDTGSFALNSNVSNKDLFLLPSGWSGTGTIILDWGDSTTCESGTGPRDLDVHLEFNSYHLYYGNRNTGPAEAEAHLDTDCTSTGGIETITIDAFMANTTYQYYIKSYSGESFNNTVNVRIINGNGVTVASWTAISNGNDYWYVFDFVVDGSGESSIQNRNVYRSSAP